MCGIIGYTGENEALDKVVTGLEILEYRGYDSVGICAREDGKLRVIKTKGRVANLRKKLGECTIKHTKCAIGHTRWATHGAPSDINAHPHRVGNACLVHNGIIENYAELRAWLEKEGVAFVSETDTEVGCALINRCYEKVKNPLDAIRLACEEMRGSYAFAIAFENEEGSIYAVRQGSPLIIARGKDGYYLASDLTALLPFTREYYPVCEGEIVRLTPCGAEIYGKGEPQWKRTNMTFESAKKGGYEHYMLKEIYEQPRAIKSSVSPRMAGGVVDFSCDGVEKELLLNISEVHIVACGSAMHAGLVGASYIEKLSGVNARCFIASEYRYNPPVTREGTLVILVSQSGETADTLASLRYARSVGLKALAIVNAVETTIAREADYRVYTYAGPEIAVATTKGYATQLSVLYLLAIALGVARGKIGEDRAKELSHNLLEDAPKVIDSVLSRREEIRSIAEKIYKREDIFYIGRGIDYALSQEASLKLKEISYVHCEAYAAGELKHGTISLIEEGTPVIAIATEKRLFDKTDSNVKEVKSRGAFTVVIGSDEMKKCGDVSFILPKCSEIGGVFGALVSTQLLAYEVACLRGCDVDKPRNLAKSVTVE